MNLKHVFLALTIASATAGAQELAPELAPLAAKHRSEADALAVQKATATARAQKPYLAALEGAEKSALGASQLPVVAAIGKEREAIAAGTAGAAFPAELPKNLQTERRACLEELGRIQADTATRQQRSDADYVRALVQLQSRAGSNPVLAEQIKAEKERILSSAAAVPSGASATRVSAVAGTRGKDLLTQKIANSKWTMFAKKDFTEQKREISFNADGTGIWGQSAQKWETIDAKSIKFRYGVITFAEDFNSFTYTEGGNTEFGKRRH